MTRTDLHHQSTRRSHVRARVLLILLLPGAMTTSRMADLAGIDAKRLGWALYGCRGKYRAELGLVRAGLVEDARVGATRRLRLTAEGRRHAGRVLRERRGRGWA